MIKRHKNADKYQSIKMKYINFNKPKLCRRELIFTIPRTGPNPRKAVKTQGRSQSQSPQSTTGDVEGDGLRRGEWLTPGGLILLVGDWFRLLSKTKGYPLMSGHHLLGLRCPFGNWWWLEIAEDNSGPKNMVDWLSHLSHPRQRSLPVEGVGEHLVGHAAGENQSWSVVETKLFFHLPGTMAVAWVSSPGSAVHLATSGR